MKKILIYLVFSLAIFLISTHLVLGDVFSASGQLGQYYTPELSMDGDDKTNWCANKTAESGKATLFGETFDDWWQVEFSTPQTIGSLYMKSGMFYGVLYGHKIKDFVWAYQQEGSSSWVKINEADMYANRYQLIFRFGPVSNVKRMRLLSRARDPYEITLGKWDPNYVWGSNNPCLREVAFYPEKNAIIKTEPWFYGVQSFENRHIYYSGYYKEDFDRFLAEITGKNYPDSNDVLWIAEFHDERIKGIGIPVADGSINLTTEGDGTDNRRIVIGNDIKTLGEVPISQSYSDWMLHEPAPAGFIFTGSILDYQNVSAPLLSGFYNFMKANYMNYPMLGNCGGHQLIAMTLGYDTYDTFKTELKPYPDSTDQMLISCGTIPTSKCADNSLNSCCRESIMRRIVPNMPDRAMTNDFSTNRYDMLFNLLDREEGFKSAFGHYDCVDPFKIRDDFDIIATYPKTYSGLSQKNFCLTQAIKLKGYPVYGTQFHPDTWRIRGAGQPRLADKEVYRNMERVEKNFFLIALNQLKSGNLNSIVPSSTKSGSMQNLYDLDRASMWCSSTASSSLVFNFKSPITLRYLVTVEGDTSLKSRAWGYVFEYSNDGSNWVNIPFSRKSLYLTQKESDSEINNFTCDTGSDKLSGAEDSQTMLIMFNTPVAARYLRMRMDGSADGSCIREVMMLNLDGMGGSLHPPEPISPKGEIGNTTPTFFWTPAEGAPTYSVWIVNVTQSYSTTFYSGSTTSTSLTLPPSNVLKKGVNYGWQVRASYPNSAVDLGWQYQEVLGFRIADIETCNNMDDDGDGVIDEGCDDDRDTFWDAKGTCIGKYRAGNNVAYDCRPEWADLDDTNPSIGSEKCNNKDDDLDGYIDFNKHNGKGCDDDKDTWWDNEMICEGKYLAGNNVTYDCKPEWSDEDDTDPNIKHQEICNNKDGDGDGVIDNGCDDDGDGFWDSEMICKGKYLAGSCSSDNLLNLNCTWYNGNWVNTVYDCAPERSDCDDTNATIGYDCPSSKADLDGNGKVDVSDLSIVALDFGRTSGFSNSKSDTNNDDIVDIFDIVYVASRFT